MNTLSLQLHCSEPGGFALTVDVDLPDHGVTAVYGPSGSGKTTLLECISGLRRGGDESLVSYRGELWEGPGHFLPPWQRRIGFVFQNARLFPHLSTDQNLDYGRRRRTDPGQVSRQQVITWLELEPLLERSPASLSAGQRQRVAIGRALLCSPQLLLLDEPLANLDHRARDQCLAYLQTLQSQLNLPMIYVSHDIGEVSQLADHLLLLEQGEVAAQGPLLDLCGRLDTRLAHDEQAAAILWGTIKRHDTGFGLTELDVEAETVYVNQLAEKSASASACAFPHATSVSVESGPNPAVF